MGDSNDDIRRPAVLVPDLVTGEVAAPLRACLEAMPKTEIHVHIEGTLSPDRVWAMARRNKVDLPVGSLEDWRRFYAFTSFAHFIEVYIAATAALKEPEDYVEMMEDFCALQAAQNILYTEAFLSASLHLDRLPNSLLIDAIFEGLHRGMEKHGVAVRLIPDIGRDFPHTQTAVLDFILEGRDRGPFIGLGLGGSEGPFPPQLFIDTYRAARAEGLRVVVHAGEAAGPQSVIGALDDLGAERIGHGVRSLEDPALMDRLVSDQTPLEVCPVSNYRLGIVPAGGRHPIHELVHRGAYCTVNSDDPLMFGTSLLGDYLLLAEEGMDWPALWQLNRNTLEATFLDEPAKRALRQRYDAFEARLG